jgi:hypothetical protein
MGIRSYTPGDYEELKQLYINSGWFDELVDSEEMLGKQIDNDPNSILVAVSDNKIIGSVSLLSTNRLALFFRLISSDENLRQQLLKKGEEFFINKGYKRLDIVVPDEDLSKHDEYMNAGFTKGNAYRWFWKESK